MRKIGLITGRLGKGKTTLGFHEARQLYPGRGIFVFDPKCAFQVGVRVRSLQETLNAIQEQADVIVFQPYDVEKGFSEFASAVWSCRNAAVLVDEASYLQSPYGLHADLDKMIRMGGEQNLSLILTQHRIADTHGLLQMVVTEFDFFQTKFRRELKRIEEIAGEEVAQKVSGLGDHEFLQFDVEGESYHVNRDPQSWREKIKQEEVEANG